MLKKLKSKFSFSDLAKNSSMSFGLRIIGLVLGYIFTLMLSNYFGAESVGFYALAFVFLQMVSMIARLGMDMALVKFIAEYKEKKQNFFIKQLYFMVLKLIFPITILLSIVAFTLSPYIAKYLFNKEQLGFYFQLASLGILPYTFIFIHSESLRGLHKIKEYMFLQNISTTLFALMVVGMAILYSIKALVVPVVALIVGIYVTFIFSVWLWKKHLSILLQGMKYSLSNENYALTYKKLFSIAVPMTLTSYLAIVMGSTDTVMLGMYATEKDVGIYSVVLKLTAMTLIVFMAVNTLTVPKFAAYWGNGNLDLISKLSKESTKLILYVSLPIFIVIWLFPIPILSMFGMEFIEGANALIIMTIGQFLFIIAGPVWQIMNMTNKQKVFFYFSVLSALVNVMLNYILIPIYGLAGAAFATVAGGIILNILSILYIKKEFNLLTLYIPILKG